MELLKANDASRGILTKMDSNDEARDVLSILLGSLRCVNQSQYKDTADYVINKAFEFYDEADEAVITHIICNTVMGDIHISLVIGTRKDPVPNELDTEDGVFAYVYNASVTYDSGLGYIFLEKRNDGYHRIG